MPHVETGKLKSQWESLIRRSEDGRKISIILPLKEENKEKKSKPDLNEKKILETLKDPGIL